MATHDAVDRPQSEAIERASDASLVQAVRAGSQAALAVLYDRHGRAVFTAAMRVGADHWIAAEVVQETFLTLWDRAELFDPARGALPAWLARIARNRAIDRLRAATRHDRAASFSSLHAEPDDGSMDEWLMGAGAPIGLGEPDPVPEIALVDSETRASIEDALSALDPLERRVIVLAYQGGLSQSEIATSLGWPIGTVKTRTRRALRHLRDRLEVPGAGIEPDREPPRFAARSHGSRGDRVAGAGTRDCLAPC
jgi:RNA polymerase sigma-70 factor (ECF subfamily)